MFSRMRDYIKDVMSRIRSGFYRALITRAADEYRRMQIEAEWGPTLENVPRISSPILDVIPDTGTRVAVISQDGVPEHPAVLGQLWDDENSPDDMTVWVRANLKEEDGQLELGAEKGLRLKVGDNEVDITPTDDGNIVLDVSGSGEIHLGEGASEAVLKGDTHLSELIKAFNDHTHPVPVGGSSGTPVPTWSKSVDFPQSKSDKSKTE